MTNRIDFLDYFNLRKYGISDEDIVKGTLGCNPSAINEDVIIAPFWKPEIYSDYVESVDTIIDGKVYELFHKDKKITFIQSGIGAPQIGDDTLALSCTKCKRIVFTGSVGGLDKNQRIGDLIIPIYSISGDGYSKYLKGCLWKHKEFEAAYPDQELSSAIKTTANRIIKGSDINISEEAIFSTDAVIAQFMYIDEIKRKYKCNGIEMETSAVFLASSLIGIKTAALLQISDVCENKKTLFAGRIDQEQEKRKLIKKTLIPRIVLETFLSIAKYT